MPPSNIISPSMKLAFARTAPPLQIGKRCCKDFYSLIRIAYVKVFFKD
jgi:hypothetical protein